MAGSTSRRPAPAHHIRPIDPDGGEPAWGRRTCLLCSTLALDQPETSSDTVHENNTDGAAGERVQLLLRDATITFQNTNTTAAWRGEGGRIPPGCTDPGGFGARARGQATLVRRQQFKYALLPRCPGCEPRCATPPQPASEQRWHPSDEFLLSSRSWWASARRPLSSPAMARPWPVMVRHGP